MIYMQTQWYFDILNINYTAHHGVKSHSHAMMDIFVFIYPEAEYLCRHPLEDVICKLLRRFQDSMKITENQYDVNTYILQNMFPSILDKKGVCNSQYMSIKDKTARTLICYLTKYAYYVLFVFFLSMSIIWLYTPAAFLVASKPTVPLHIETFCPGALNLNPILGLNITSSPTRTNIVFLVVLSGVVLKEFTLDM